MTGASGALIGAASGCLATAPMSLAMAGMHRQLPWYERYPLPPRQIVRRATGLLGLGSPASHGLADPATLASHFTYGAACGAVYGALAAPPRLAGPATGVAFGLVVWLVSYAGVLPAVGLFQTPRERPGRRNWLMVAAHVVWGASLGLAVRVLGGDPPLKGEGRRL